MWAYRNNVDVAVYWINANEMQTVGLQTWMKIIEIAQHSPDEAMLNISVRVALPWPVTLHCNELQKMDLLSCILRGRQSVRINRKLSKWP